MTILEAARQYHDDGFSVIPCGTDKRPAIAWKKYTEERASVAQIEKWFSGRNHSIGLVGGAVSQNIVFIDLDGLPAVKKFADKFPHLCNTTKSVRTGSGEGIHLYVRVDKLPRNTNVRVPGVGGFEVRASGQYVIAPPSGHPSGHRYRIHNDFPIAHLPDVDDITAWMRSLLPKQKRMQSDFAQQVFDDKCKRGYLNKVVSGEIARVQYATQGNRNNSLFYASLRLANFCAGGELSWQDMKMRLFNTAMSVGMPEAEARRTIASAFRIGSCNPRKVS